ncbi:MAG: phosphatidylglycerol lysyltransferase domain-containing protein [Fusobacteriaceae bacterium]
MNLIKKIFKLMDGETDDRDRGELEYRRTLMEKVRNCLSISKNENGFLAFLEDKSFFFYPAGSEERCFIMYGQTGGSYIAMGDPVGDTYYFEKCIEEFKSFCKKERKKCIFYEVDHENIGDYIKNSMTVSKIGERGKILLRDFTLEGSEMRKLRYLYKHLEKVGYNFKIIKKENLDIFMEELKSVSNEWLKNKNSSEKKFSIGRFSSEYIKNFHVAVIERDEKIVAFANIYGTPGKDCLTLDLMRHINNLENGVMEYFFISLILHAKEEGYENFSLGIVPLSGIEKNHLTPYKNIENFIFNHEKHFYNFKGLKFFKDKFKPQWEPVYITYYGHLIFPLVLKDIISLTSNGIIKAVRKTTDKNQKK